MEIWVISDFKGKLLETGSSCFELGKELLIVHVSEFLVVKGLFTLILVAHVQTVV